MKKKYFIFFLLIFYFFLQLSSLDYGFKINDLEYFKTINLNDKDIKSFLDRKEIKTKGNINSSLPKWQYRYKLYSINADEIMPIMALSKIKINERKFDTQVYKYGGAFLYPLGIYYYSLIKLKMIMLMSKQSLIIKI